jgi:cytochrome P450
VRDAGVALDDVDLTDLDRFAGGFPHDVFTRLRREAPVWFHPPTAHTPGGEGFWVLSRHADVVAAGGDGELFSSESGGARAGGGTLIEDLPAGFAAGVLLNMMDDPRHLRRRRLLTPALSPRALHAMEDDLRARATALIDGAVTRGTCDFVADVAAELPLQAMARLLGVPQEDRGRLFAWAEATLDYEGRSLGETTDRTRAASAGLFEYGGRLIAEKRARPGDDLLSAAVHGRVRDGDGEAEAIGELELQMLFNLLVAAGSETTRNSIAVGLLALIDHPAQWRALRDDRALLPRAVEEILRWASSTPYNRRTVTRDVTLRGAHLRAGDKVTLWWASANRDEAVFEDPFRFDVRRDPNPHLAFGHGTHFCLGGTLARLEVRVLLDVLLDRVETAALAGPVQWGRSNKHTGVRRLPLVLTPRPQPASLRR